LRNRERRVLWQGGTCREPSEAGINALDGLIVAYNAIAALRQHIRDTARVHGIITDGGQMPNVVPNHAAAIFLARAEDEAYLEDLKTRVVACFEAGAIASGARLEYRWMMSSTRPSGLTRPWRTLFAAIYPMWDVPSGSRPSRARSVARTSATLACSYRRSTRRSASRRVR